MREVPARGRVVIVDFERRGMAVPPEMVGVARPCVVVQNNTLSRASLVTVVPLSTTEPHRPGKQHHKMSHLSFRDWPLEWDGQGTHRWAKCDYVTTISLERCTDPYKKERFGGRRYLKIKIAKADLDAIEKCILWSMGIDPRRHCQSAVQEADTSMTEMV